MGNRQLTLADRYHGAKRKLTDKIKSALIDDTPPGVAYKNGEATPSLAAMKAFSERFTIASILPYESYDAEQGIYYNRDTVGFMLYANPATSLSNAELLTLNGLFNQNHKADTTIQVSMIADPNIDPLLHRWADAKSDAIDRSIAPIFEILAKNRVEYLHKGSWDSLFSEQPFLLRNMHLVISYTIPVPKGLLVEEMAEADIEHLMRISDSAIGTLRSAGIFSKRMEPDLFINIMNGLINPSKSPQPRLYYDDNILISKQIVDDDTLALFGSGVSSLIHKNEAFSVLPYHVRQFPPAWAGFRNNNLIGSFTNNILRIPCPFIATLTVNATDQVIAKGHVQRKSLRATQMVDAETSKYVPQWKDRKIDWDYTAKKVDNGNKLMGAFYQILLFAPQGQEQACEQALKSTYDSIGWVLSKSRYTPIHSFLGALPMGLCQEAKRGLKIFGHFDTRLSWTCTNVAPWIGEWKGTKTPMMLFSGRRGQLMYFDPFDNVKGNYNISCSATPGSGKSFFTQDWICSCLGSGGRAFVIDAGHSYRDLCSLLKGTYLDFGDKSLSIRLNPFSSIDPNDPDFLADQMPLLMLLISQMASPAVALSSKQEAVLEKAIMTTWRTYKNKSTITLVAECLSKDHSDDGISHATAKDLSVMLYPFTKEGRFGSYFEGESNIDLDNYFIVLDLDALNNSPALQSTVLLILMMRITQVMYLSGNRKQRKLCIIDEAWRLLGAGRSGQFIEEGYRVARKHGGSFMTITQRIGDYYRSDVSQAAYSNSDFKVFLRQDATQLANDERKGYVNNASGQLDIIRSLETVQGKYSELLIDSPSGMAPVRFVVDQVAEKIYSTQAAEIDFLREAEARGVPLLDAIQELIKKSGAR